MVTPPAPAPNVELLFGPMLIGVLLNTTLYGVTNADLVIQILIYYNRYKQDRKWVRYLVLYLLVAETVNVVFDIGLIYEPLIFRYATARALVVSPLLLRPGTSCICCVGSSESFILVAISMPVQLFVAWRVKMLTQSYFVPILIAVLAIVSFGGGLSVTIMVSLRPEYAGFGNFHPFVMTWLSSSAACDVILSMALIYSLRTRKTGAGATDRYVDRIICLTVQTGSITAIAAMLDLLVFFFTPIQFIWDLPLSKLYSNALLSTLNTRPWREEVSQYTVNVLFDTTPSDDGLQIRSIPHTALEMQRRRRDTTYANGEVSDDLERGGDVQKVSQL
ncbi:hypothetical protein DFH09DRAFT_1151871 [Mycena vulgaris]|nr:hypothetical protein DFH09DRAFT_1151871 [Mycena vulgaris]